MPRPSDGQMSISPRSSSTASRPQGHSSHRQLMLVFGRGPARRHMQGGQRACDEQCLYG